MKSRMISGFKGKRRKTQAGLATVLAIFLFGIPTQVKAACVNPAGTAGAVVYNSDVKVFQYCNNTSWVRMTKPGTGAGGCANPALAEGKLVYNDDNRVLQGCAGNVHRAAGIVGGANKWISLSRGYYRNLCAIKNDRSAWCMGSYPGDGTTTSEIFVEVSGNSTWKEISTGGGTTCGIKSDDTLWCWGADTYGQIGDGATAGPQLNPVQVSGGGTWKQISVGNQTNCAIKSDDTLWCWGADTRGSVGNGAITGNQDAPYAVGGGSWKYVSVGGTGGVSSNSPHVCGIKSDDTLWCWGENGNSQIGNGNATDQISPVQIGGATAWKKVAPGNVHTCAIKSDDTLWCWGNDTVGQLGNGASGNATTPAAVTGGLTWKDVETNRYEGFSNTCAIRSNDTLYCWGHDDYGLMLDGVNGPDIQDPTLMSLASPQQASILYRSYCYLDSRGSILCWGDDVGDGAYSLSTETNSQHGITMAPVYGDDDWKYIAAGGDDSNYGASCGIKSDDTLWCWSSGSPVASPTYLNVDRPQQVSGGGAWKMVTIGHYGDIACAIKGDDTGYCWGEGANGKLGTGSTAFQGAPTVIAGGGTWKMLSAGRIHGCGIKSDDTAWCWGSDTNGRLGNGATTGDQSSPQAVDGGGTWKWISAGSSATCGIKSDDTAWCWGTDASGELGNGATTGDQVSPVAVSTGLTFKSIHVGSSTACALDMGGQLYCWGSNAWGIYGDNNVTPSSNVPVLAAGGMVFSAFHLSHGNWKHALGISGTAGTLYSWGEGGMLCQNGFSSCAQVNVPTVPPGGDVGFTDVSCAETHCCAIAKSKAYCFGVGTGMGALGRATWSNSPVQISCSGPHGNAGEIVYNSDFNVMQYCDGAGWVEMRQ